MNSRQNSTGTGNGHDKPRIISLGIVHIPHYADRPQLVTAGQNHDYRIDEYHRWAERLDDNIARVLQQNLAILLPNTLIQANHGRSSDQDTLHLGIDILDFISDETGKAKLLAQWSISKAHQVLVNHQSSQNIPLAGNDTAHRVEAMNTALNLLSGEIAEDLSKPSLIFSEQSGP